MTEEIKRLRRVCFTGHRPEKLNRSEKSVLDGLETAIRQAIADGSNVFISGMARGVDIWAAEIVLQIRSEGEDIIFCEGISSQFIDNAPEDDGE